ncbi:hypothetical protein [Chryseobacterium polytrichastri]|uniref:Uncharacterized protein n=1 Tax=Chryseobacterium polytrichastri TaxID=1302687 RepID=A0A1M7KGC0_9FLAO|nr:hypothetical protein [Chryseobacterium polytrichastri]SHM64133.1 hypothetical protein SAMN05444267_10612 [Chryseobacterium polytrichastri]
MEINEIRNQIVEKLCSEYSIWCNLLNSTQPKNYICNQWKVDLNPTDIDIDISNKNFFANEGFFISDITVNSNTDREDTPYNKAFTAKGKFEFETEYIINIKEIDIDLEIDIF